VPLWQTLNDVTYCQQLPTDQAGGWAAATALKAPSLRNLVADKRQNKALSLVSFYAFIFDLLVKLLIIYSAHIAVNS